MQPGTRSSSVSGRTGRAVCMTSAAASSVAMAASETIARILATKRLLDSVNVADLLRTLCLRELDTARAQTVVFPHWPPSLAILVAPAWRCAPPQLEPCPGC